MTWLWTGGGKGVPEEYIDLVLCRDIYHTTPDRLADQDYPTVMLHLSLHSAEQKVKGLKEKAAHDKAKRRGKGKGKKGKR